MEHLYTSLEVPLTRLEDGIGMFDALSNSFVSETVRAQRAYGKALHKIVETHLPSKVVGRYPSGVPSLVCTKYFIASVRAEAMRVETMANALEATAATTTDAISRLESDMKALRGALSESRKELEGVWAGVEASRKTYEARGVELADTMQTLFKNHMSLKEKQRKKLADKKEEATALKAAARSEYEAKISEFNSTVLTNFTGARAEVATRAEMVSAQLSRRLAAFFSKTHTAMFPHSALVKIIERTNKYASVIGTLSVPLDLRGVFADAHREGPLPDPVRPRFDKKDRKAMRIHRTATFSAAFEAAYGIPFEDEKAARRSSREARNVIKEDHGTFTIKPRGVAPPADRDLYGVTKFLSPFGNYAAYGRTFDAMDAANSASTSAGTAANSLYITLADVAACSSIDQTSFIEKVLASSSASSSSSPRGRGLASHGADNGGGDGSEFDDEEDEAFFAQLLVTGLSTGVLSAPASPLPSSPPAPDGAPADAPASAVPLSIPIVRPRSESTPTATAPTAPPPSSAPAPPLPRRRRPPRRRPQSLIINSSVDVSTNPDATSASPTSPSPSSILRTPAPSKPARSISSSSIDVGTPPPPDPQP